MTAIKFLEQIQYVEINVNCDEVEIQQYFVKW